MKQKWLAVLAAGAIGASVTLSSFAADYPTKTIQIVNPFPPGALTDTIARLVADKLSTSLGQSTIVVNKTGGGGAIGYKAVKDAPADGYTLLITPPPLVLIPLARKNIGFALSDFAPLNLVGTTPSAMIVKADAPWQNVEQLIADAKKKPGTFTFGSPGAGTMGHFTLELFKRETGVDMIHVPMGGEGPVATAVLGGNLHTSIIALGTARPHLESGGLRVLATTGSKRSKEFPDAPTMIERGFPTIEASPWFVFFVRNGTPKEISAKLARAIREAVQDKELAGKIEKGVVEIENRGPEESAKILAAFNRKWTEVAKSAKIVAE